MKAGTVKMVVGRKLLDRFAVISKSAILFVFQDSKCGKPLHQMKLDSTTQVGMVDKIKNGFSINNGKENFIFSCNEDTEMASWTNTALKIQVTGVSGFENQTSDSFSRTIHAIEQASLFSNKIKDAATQLNDQAALLARISALEEMVRQKDKELEVLRGAQA